MDPVTQGALGAAAAQLVLQKHLGPRAWLYGALGGMAADLDIFIRSDVDPLVGWTYHRHFTHSLAFVPIGGLVSGLPFIWRKPRARKKLILAATTVGYATHALLDAFTSYGTQLLWPFSSARIAWNWIGIIDPFFTLPLCVAVVVAARRDRLRPLWIVAAWCALYMGWGGVQHARAKAHAERLALRRGHVLERVEAFPGVITNVLWRTVYLSEGRIHIDAVHVPWVGSPTHREGGSVARVGPDEHAALADGDPHMEHALGTFEWFTDGWVAEHPDDSNVLGDLRYGVAPASTTSMWGLRLGVEGPLPYDSWRASPQGRELGERASLWFTGFDDAARE